MSLSDCLSYGTPLRWRAYSVHSGQLCNLVFELAELPDRERLARLVELRDEGTDLFALGPELSDLSVILAGQIAAKFPMMPVQALFDFAREVKQRVDDLPYRRPDCGRLRAVYGDVSRVITATVEAEKTIRADPKGPERQIRLQAVTDAENPHFLLDGKLVPCESEVMIHFVAELINANGRDVAFSGWLARRPEFVGSRSDREMKRLPKQIIPFIDHGQGRHFRLNLEALAKSPGKAW
jgi:hypothetical protein